MRIEEKSYASPGGETVPVISGLEMSLPPRAFTCLIGPSGCGKTTTLRILLGLDDEFEGKIDDRFRTARLAAAFQEPRLLPWRTVRQNVDLALPRDMTDREAVIGRALADVGLEELLDRYPGQLSLGQARRAALARAFAVRPDILFLDEPFVSLDEATAQRLRGLLIELWTHHPVTVLMVTHNVREAVQLADRIVLLTHRPARVVGEVAVTLPREARTQETVGAFAAELARRHPGLVTL
ncbi:ABC transporter ATP-binding protein [Lutibaculum baratangense]|uniref:ABC transporter ATP-binding protein n=1 Tax=Lutibaculum baratangense TaxID=1358440 RepID=UPI001FCAB720|nr:ATP-binding cassette domain-containing protein [Lutibaculum baratangense]